MEDRQGRINIVPVVIATTTMYRNNEMLRPRLALRLAEATSHKQYSLVVVDGGERERFERELRERGAYVFKQKQSGFGSARRQAYREAIKIEGKKGIIVATEPEKYPLIPELYKVIEPILRNKADLVIPYRKSMASYPPEQEFAEKMVNLVVKYLTGREFDFSFGPFVMGAKALPYFLKYRGEYGDLWDSHQIPKLRVIAAGLRVVSVEVNYRHPKEQTIEEKGNIDFIRKRIEQLENQSLALIKESQRLKKL